METGKKCFKSICSGVKMKDKIHSIWRSLTHTVHAKNLNKIHQKREIVFNKLMLLGILFLAITFIALLLMASFIAQNFSVLSSIHIIPHLLLTGFYILLFMGIYYYNSIAPSINKKVLAHILIHVYIFLLCIFSGEDAHIEITIFALMNLPYFVVEEEKKSIFILSTFIGLFFLLAISIWYQYQKPLFHIPIMIQVYSFYLAALFNILIISLCSYQFYIETVRTEKSLELEQSKSENLLLNILPREIVQQLKETGSAPAPRKYESVSVLFTDFQGFTKVAEKMSPESLVQELDNCFTYFDSIVQKYKLEKLKTIGDSYMCAGGIPLENTTHPVDIVLAALKIQEFMDRKKRLNKKKDLDYWKIRIGIHTGPLVAGVIGKKKFIYDVWGDTVNTASRMESGCEAGRVNISEAMYERIKSFFECEYRGKVHAKNKGWIRMYFVIGIKKELSLNNKGRTPNTIFLDMYQELT
jgi:class 3 adenylate cyclase